MYETAGMPGDLPAGADTFDLLPGLQRGEQLRRTDKAVTVAGRWHGRDVVAKQLISSERQWVERFAHEVSAYQAFAVTPPPWRVPLLQYAGHTVLVIERLPGAPPHTDRYPPRLPEPIVTAMIDAMAAFASWRPPPRAAQHARHGLAGPYPSLRRGRGSAC
ncbi:hypothetical protein ACWEOZ_25940 [Actinoplanes sp. NPDC004185]